MNKSSKILTYSPCSTTAVQVSKKEMYDLGSMRPTPIQHNWCQSTNRNIWLRHWAMLKPTIRLLSWKSFSPYDSTGSVYLYVTNILHTFVLQWPHLKEKVGQPKHAFHIMLILVCIFNIQTWFETGAICGGFLSAGLKFGEEKAAKEGNFTFPSQTSRIPIDPLLNRGKL